MLATLGVPLDLDATQVAVDAAVEAGQRLIAVNVVELLLAPMEVVMRWSTPDEPGTDELRAAAALAASCGVPAEHLRVKSPHPIQALVELAAERRPGLLVFGPDRSALRPRRYRKAARAIRDRAPCLVWLADD